MDVVALCVAIVGAAIYVAVPLYRSAPEPPAADPQVTGRSTAALADLEVDRASGLIDDATYHRERAALEESGLPTD